MTAKLLTFTQAAQRLGVDVGTIRRWVRTEQCPAVRDGRRVRIPAEWVDDPRGWLDDRGGLARPEVYPSG